ncbi:MAG: C39 family peptidase, partial [Chloroflexota bacterium]|nr:C39 family peptidase [Chloroflexota bacterium]
MRARRIFIALLVFPLTLACLAIHQQPTVEAATTIQPYVGLRKHTTTTGFAGSPLTGVVVGSSGGRADIHLGRTGLSRGDNRLLYGNPSPYWYGTLLSPVFTAPHRFDTAIMSWNARTPAGTWLSLEVRAYRPGDGHWTKYYKLGIWASGTGTIHRHSVAGQGDRDGYVATDTLLLYGNPAAYTRYQYRLRLFSTNLSATPRVNLISVMTSDSYKEPVGLAIPSDHQAWGKDLAVPRRSQMTYAGGDGWCSPTSTSMLLAYWGKSVTVPGAAAGTYDYVYRGNGNWPFN